MKTNTEISPNIISALKTIAQKLASENIKWIISTSCALALQGIKIEPKNIDIITDNKELLKINELLKCYKIESFIHNPSERFDSIMNKFLINDCDVDIMNNFKIKSKTDNIWHNMSYLLKNPTIIQIEQIKMPVISLSQALEMYELMGREKDLIKIEMIKEHLNERKFFK